MRVKVMEEEMRDHHWISWEGGTDGIWKNGEERFASAWQREHPFTVTGERGKGEYRLVATFGCLVESPRKLEIVYHCPAPALRFCFHWSAVQPGRQDFKPALQDDSNAQPGLPRFSLGWKQECSGYGSCRFFGHSLDSTSLAKTSRHPLN